MTDDELRRAAQRLRRDPGDLPEYVVAELRRAVRGALATGRLPAAFSPTGNWDGDVSEDLLHSWLTEKLMERGQLLALLDRARSARAFYSMAKRSFYHWLLDARPRSQASNIYRRLVEGLERDPRFSAVRRAAERQHHLWALASRPGAPAFTGSESQLSKAAFAFGDIDVVVWDSERVSPGIATGDLLDFAARIMRELSAALTPVQIMGALGARMDLGAPDIESLATLAATGHAADAAVPPAEANDDAYYGGLAITFLELLDRRQTEVLLWMERGGETADALAGRLGCSPSTIANERKRIAAYVERLARDDGEATLLLQKTMDLLYEPGDD